MQCRAPLSLLLATITTTATTNNLRSSPLPGHGAIVRSNPLKELPALPKPHYSWPIEGMYFNLSFADGAYRPRPSSPPLLSPLCPLLMLPASLGLTSAAGSGQGCWWTSPASRTAYRFRRTHPAPS